MYEVIRLINLFSKVPYELFFEYSSDFHGVEDIPPKLTPRFLVAPSESSGCVIGEKKIAAIIPLNGGLLFKLRPNF